MGNRKRLVYACLIWECTLLALAIVTGEISLSWRINQLRWRLFGYSGDHPYGFTTLYVPMILSWLLYSIPASLAGMWAYRKLDRAERETRCRRCGYIQRGLAEPRCSECGERI